MYSAVSVGGKRLYQLARAGVTVERQPRMVTIESIDILSVDGCRVTVQVECSKGTYIRTLCADIGEALGCGAHLESLCRTRSGMFSIESAVTLEQLAEYRESGRLDEVLTPLDALFAEYPAFRVSGENEKRVKNGVPLKLPAAGLSPGQTYRVYAADGEFLCLSRYENDTLTMVKGFY